MWASARSQRLRPTTLVFSKFKRTPPVPDNIAKRNFSQALRRAEIQRAKKNQPAIGKVRWHALRHAFGSLNIDQGESRTYAMRQMGHISIEVTVGIYAHKLNKTNPKAAAKTDAMIFGE